MAREKDYALGLVDPQEIVFVWLVFRWGFAEAAFRAGYAPTMEDAGKAGEILRSSRRVSEAIRILSECLVPGGSCNAASNSRNG